MSHHGSLPQDLEYDPVKDLADMEFTQWQQAPADAYTPKIERHNYSHTIRSSSTIPIAVEDARLEEDARSQQYYPGSSTQWEQAPSESLLYAPLHASPASPANSNQSNTTRYTSARSLKSPIRTSKNVQRYSPYPGANVGLQTHNRARSQTAASPSSAIHLSPTYQRGTKPSSARRSTTSPKSQLSSPRGHLPGSPIEIGDERHHMHAMGQPLQTPSQICTDPFLDHVTPPSLVSTGVQPYTSASPQTQTEYPFQGQRTLQSKSPVPQSRNSQFNGGQLTTSLNLSTPGAQQPANPQLSSRTTHARSQNFADRLFRYYVTQYAQQHSVTNNQIQGHVLHNFKIQAQAETRRTIHEQDMQSEIMLLQQQQKPSIPYQNPQVERLKKPQTSPRRRDATTDNGPNSSKSASPTRHEGSLQNATRPSPVTNSQDEQTDVSKSKEHRSERLDMSPTIQPDPFTQPTTANDKHNEPAQAAKLENLRDQLSSAIHAANGAFVQRAKSVNRFHVLYPQLQQNVLNATYALFAGYGGLDHLATLIWKADDKILLIIVQGVSILLHNLFTHVQRAVRVWLAPIVDPEFKWTALSRSFELFYNSFSSLKASLKTRDDKRGDGQQTLVNALRFTRAHIWTALRPLSDDELDASLSAEQAQYRAQSMEVTADVKQEWEAMFADQSQSPSQALEKNEA